MTAGDIVITGRHTDPSWILGHQVIVGTEPCCCCIARHHLNRISVESCCATEETKQFKMSAHPINWLSHIFAVQWHT